MVKQNFLKFLRKKGRVCSNKGKLLSKRFREEGMKKNFLFCFLVAVLITSCAAPTYQSTVKYIDKDRNYKVIVTSDFERCKKVGIKVVDGEKTLFETWEKGGGKNVEFFVSDRVLKEGENVLKLFCDDKPNPKTIQIKNSRYPYMNLIYVGIEEGGIIRPEYNELFNDLGFYSELRNFLLSGKENYEKTKELVNLFPTHLRTQLLIDIVTKYNDPITIRGAASEARALLHEEKSDDLLMLLYKKNNPDVDSDVTYLLLSRPVKRYYDKFFSVMLTKPNIYPLIVEHLETNGTSEFSQLVFSYIKEKAEKGEMDGFVTFAFPVYLKSHVEANTYTKQLLFSGDKKKEELAIKIYKEYGIDQQSGLYIRENWDKLSVEAKHQLAPLILEKYGNETSFYKKFLKTEDKELKRLLYKVGLQIENRYNDPDIVNFYLAEDDRGLVYQYFLVAPKDIKFKGLSRFYEKTHYEKAILIDIKDANPDYFAKKLLENFLFDKNDSNVVFAAEQLAAFKDKYLAELVKAYEQEKVNVDKRQKVLSFIAMSSEAGAKYAYDKVKTEPYTDALKEVYRNIARIADGAILEDLLKNLTKFSNEVFMSVSIGFEESRKKFDCELLKQIYTSNKDKDVRFRVIWTWAYCCPDTYFDNMFNVFKNDMTEEVFVEAIDGVRDVIKDVKPSLADRGFKFLEEVYPAKRTKAVRAKIVDVVFDAGDKTRLNIIEKLAKDAEDKEEKEFFEERISTFKREKNVKE